MLPPGPADAVSCDAAGAAGAASAVVCTCAGAAASVVLTGAAGLSFPPGTAAAVVLVVPEPEPPGETGDGDALPPGVPAEAAVVLEEDPGVCCEELPLPEWPGPS